MERASGITARKLLETNPNLYREVMAQVGQVELDLLLGIDEKGSPNPIPLFANPDFHDGQVIVDLQNKAVTVLDFGQALAISNQERKLPSWGSSHSCSGLLREISTQF